MEQQVRFIQKPVEQHRFYRLFERKAKFPPCHYRQPPLSSTLTPATIEGTRSKGSSFARNFSIRVLGGRRRRRRRSLCFDVEEDRTSVKLIKEHEREDTRNYT
ncbi:hypothetical protein K0M31_020213 [Melipona bicolor]|uniref:Uncharacterized protein n=1 Tax=Melipona bicolor TaxID=60889 RepID=A0AA40G168_9HYME|nr:hypothetical protein K0M31_020213 [Melipona bicolor]